MEGLRYLVAGQRRRLGKKEDPLPEGKELVHEFLENEQKLLPVKEDGEEKEGEEK